MKIKNISLVLIATIVSVASSLGMEKKENVTSQQERQAILLALLNHQNIEPNHEEESSGEEVSPMAKMIKQQQINRQEYKKPTNK